MVVPLLHSFHFFLFLLSKEESIMVGGLLIFRFISFFPLIFLLLLLGSHIVFVYQSDDVEIS